MKTISIRFVATIFFFCFILSGCGGNASKLIDIGNTPGNYANGGKVVESGDWVFFIYASEENRNEYDIESGGDTHTVRVISRRLYKMSADGSTVVEIESAPDTLNPHNPYNVHEPLNVIGDYLYAGSRRMEINSIIRV